MTREEQAEGARPFALLSRRRWLKLGLGAGGALLASGGGLWLWLRGSAPDVEGLVVLEPYEHRTLAAIVEILFPAGSVGTIRVAALDLPRAVDEFLTGEPEENESDLKMALTFLEVGPMIDQRRFVTFSRLPPAEREEYFRSWMTSDDLLRRQVALAFRKLLNILFYDRPEVWPLIHYPGPMLRPESTP